MTYVIAEPRIDVKGSCGSARSAASAKASGCSTSTPGECVDCGGCEPVCQVEAICYEDDVPGQRARFTAGNATFFDQLGSPGRRRQTGPLPYDTEYVAGYIVTGR